MSADEDRTPTNTAPNPATIAGEHRLSGTATPAAIAGRVFAHTQGVDVAAGDTTYRMRIGRVGHRQVELFSAGGEFIGLAIEQPRGWVVQPADEKDPQLFAARFEDADRQARAAHPGAAGRP